MLCPLLQSGEVSGWPSPATSVVSSSKGGGQSKIAVFPEEDKVVGDIASNLVLGDNCSELIGRI